MSKQIPDENELKIELLLPDDLDSLSMEEHILLLTTAPVRVTHIPTGLNAVGKDCGNQVMNHAKAVELLREHLRLKKND